MRSRTCRTDRCSSMARETRTARQWWTPTERNVRGSCTQRARATRRARAGCSRGARARRCRTMYGRSALHWAFLESGGVDVVRALLASGAPVDAKDADDFFPLYLASQAPSARAAVMAAGVQAVHV